MTDSPAAVQRAWPIEVEVELSQVLSDTPPCFPTLEPDVTCDACRARHLLASDWWTTHTTAARDAPEGATT